MTSTDPTPTLLPGVPARTWSAILQAAGLATIPIYVPLAYLRAYASDNQVNAWLPTIIVYGVIVGVALLVSYFNFSHRNQDEKAAGYTTLWRSNPTLPQLEPRTGALVRKAGEPYVKRRAWREDSVAPEPSGSNLARPSVVSRSRNVAWRIPLTAFLMAVLTLRLGLPSAVLPIYTVAAILLDIAGWFVGLGIGANVARHRLDRLRAAAPGSLVFNLTKADGFEDALPKIPEIDFEGELPARPLGATADSVGLTIWRGNPLQRYGSIPWKSVISVQSDDVTRGRTRYPGILVSFTDPDGVVAALPLPNPNADYLPLPSKAEATWILGQLNELRTGTTRPRVI